MTNTKIKMDLSSGLIETEGAESFIQTLYNDFKS